jgi:hypothetical protein
MSKAVAGEMISAKCGKVTSATAQMAKKRLWNEVDSDDE